MLCNHHHHLVPEHYHHPKREPHSFNVLIVLILFVTLGSLRNVTITANKKKAGGLSSPWRGA